MIFIKDSDHKCVLLGNPFVCLRLVGASKHSQTSQRKGEIKEEVQKSMIREKSV